MATDLPPFPVDPGTLDLLWSAINPGPDAERSSVNDLLTLYSQLGGSDTEAVADERDGIFEMRDPQYTHHDVIIALIEEIRRMRHAVGPAHFRLIVDDQGLRTLVDSGGIRWFTEEEPDFWVIAVNAAGWDGWRRIAEHILATGEPNA